MNKTILSGRLTKDPDLRYTQSGKAVASFTLAVDRKLSKSEGEKTADFIPCVAWEKLAEICGDYLTKGKKILVEGRLQIRSYEAKDGQKRWVTEVILNNMEFLENKSVAKNQDFGERTDMSSFGQDILGEDEIPF